MNKKTLNEFINEFNKKFPNNSIDFSHSVYTDCKMPFDVVCHHCFKNGKEHGKFTITPDKLLTQGGCRYCKNKQVYNIADFIREARYVHNDSYDYSQSVYLNSHIPILIKCNKCNNIFKQSPNAHLRGEGCPFCKMSKMENEIKCFLKENNLKFTYQYRINEISNKPYDFYLPDYNIIIECQGEQHFTPRTFGGNDDDAKNNFNATINNDNVKYKVALGNKINIIYYVNKKMFHKENKNIDCLNNFYKDKNIAFNKKTLIELIKKINYLL